MWNVGVRKFRRLSYVRALHLECVCAIPTWRVYRLSDNNYVFNVVQVEWMSTTSLMCPIPRVYRAVSNISINFMVFKCDLEITLKLYLLHRCV